MLTVLGPKNTIYNFYNKYYVSKKSWPILLYEMGQGFVDMF